MNKKFDVQRVFTSPVIVVLGALLCCALWGSATPFIKMGYKVMFEGGKPDVISTILFAGIRFAFAGFITVALYSIARRKVLYPKPENFGKVAIIAAFQTIIQYFFFYVGLANTSGAKGTIISGSSSFFAIFISTLMFKQEKLTAKKVIACVIGFAGIIAVNLNGLDFSMNLTGDAFVLFSAMSLAFSSVLIKIFSKSEDPVVISGYQFIVGGVFLIAVGLMFGGKVSFGNPVGIAVLVYLMFLSAIAYSLWGLLLKHNPVSRVTVYNFTTPIFGTILSLIFLRDENSSLSFGNLAATLILVSVGILLLNYVPKKQTHLRKFR